ncbi:MAG TPA: DUF1571 domain-containing protein [Pirellulaceae bacterium]|nr:DUF1571 domain-containing protein [Pirellulaceae bacterium]HMO91630.1 DUF1571 domain-containing protein [Pirellulaceae bacterium]HMP68327.1 DUF1571 domain-containing protein [Pirellulaceae bacterium]
MEEKHTEVEQSVLTNDERRSSVHVFLGLTIVCISLISFVAFGYWRTRVAGTSSYNEAVHAPEIEHQGSPSDAASERRGSITDLLLDHPLEQAAHPLDPALIVAQAGLDYLQNFVFDYTAVVAKQERVDEVLLEQEFFECKIRYARTVNGKDIPKSFYLKFVKPKRIAGREVLWVEGWNRNRLLAREAGLLGIVSVSLNPTERLAMTGNRYPITELGMENLIKRMIEKGERARQSEDCQVTYDRDIEIDGKKGTLITITQPRQMPDAEFYQAKIYIDDENNLPVGYEGFWWPETEGGPPLLIESYFYSDVKVNVGLTDLDFDRNNPDYRF